MRLRFRFRPIPLIVTILLVALGISLGNWQERRAAQKIALRDRIALRAAEPPVDLGPQPATLAPLEFRHVRVTGQFIPGWPIFLDNRPHQGRSGFYLLMPFKIAGSDLHVMVARGWLPVDPKDHYRVPAFGTPAGQVTIEGIVTGNVGHIMQLGGPAALKPAAIVQNLDLKQFALASGLASQPFFVQQTGPSQPGENLVRDWPQPSTGIDTHKGYALQWYGLAAMAFLFYVITGFRSGTKPDDAVRA
jgi:cytochrome oxidase assembly protein ShyY1